MSWLRRTSFALALAGAAGACTLIDPLDDVSGGAPKTNSGKKDASSTSSSSSGSAGDDDDAATGSTTGNTSGSSFACSGQKEEEPNDAPGGGSPLSASAITHCGTLKGGTADVDRWKFTNTTGGELQITLTINAESDLRVAMQSGSNQTSGHAGGTNITNLGPNETLTLTLTAPTGVTQDIGYQIVFTAN